VFSIEYNAFNDILRIFYNAKKKMHDNILQIRYLSISLINCKAQSSQPHLYNVIMALKNIRQSTSRSRPFIKFEFLLNLFKIYN